MSQLSHVSGFHRRWRHPAALAGLVLPFLLAAGLWVWSSSVASRWQQALGHLSVVSTTPTDAEEPSIGALVAALGDKNPRVRGDAALALGRLAAAARPHAAAKLRSLMKDPNPYVRGHVALALTRVDRDNPETAAAVARLLLDPEPQVANVAHAALREMGPAAAPIAFDLLEGGDPALRLHAVRVLPYTGRKTTEVAKALRRCVAGSDPAVRDAAILALLYDKEATLSETIGWVRSANPEISSAALAHLPVFGREAIAALPELIVCLEHPRPSELPHLLGTIRSLNSAAKPTVPALLRLLESPVDYDLVELLETLGEVDPDPPMVAPLLARYVHYDVPFIAGLAAGLLARLDPQAALRCAPVLAQRLRGRDRTKLDPALTALRGLGPCAAGAVPQLVELLREGPPNIKELVVPVLARVGPAAAPAAPTLVAMLERREPGVRLTMLVIEALGAIGPPALSAAPLLLEHTAWSPPAGRPVRCAALIAAASVGVRDGDYLAIANAALEDDAASVRIAALRVFEIVADAAVVSHAGLLRAFDDPDPMVRLMAAQTCVTAAGNAPPVIARLIGLLHDHDFDVRAVSAVALGRIGPDAATALPELQAALEAAENSRPLGEVHPSRNRERRMRSGLPRVESAEFTVARAIEAAITRITAEGTPAPPVPRDGQAEPGVSAAD